MLPTREIARQLKNGPFVALVVLTWPPLYSAKSNESKKELTCFTGHTYPLAVIEFERRHKNKEFESEKERFKTTSATVGKETCCVAIFAKKATYNKVPILIFGQAPCAANQSGTGCDYLAADNWKMSDEQTTSLLNVSKCQCTADKCNRMSGLIQGLDNAVGYTLDRWKIEEKANGCWRSKSIPHRVEKAEQPWCVNYYKLGNTHPYPKWDGDAEERCRRTAGKKNASSFCFADENEWFCCCKRPFCNKRADMDPQVAMSKMRTNVKTTTTTSRTEPATSPTRPPPTPSATVESSASESCFEKDACLNSLVAGSAAAFCILLFIAFLLFCCLTNWRSGRKKRKMRLSETQLSSVRAEMLRPRRGAPAKEKSEEEGRAALEKTNQSYSSREESGKAKSPPLKNETQNSSSASNSSEEEEEEETQQPVRDVVADSEQVDRGVGTRGADGGGDEDARKFLADSPPEEDATARDEEEEERRKDLLSPLSPSLSC